ncbi:LysE family translocator [bacterium]|nr:LysE family translocator [bacterium]
MTALFGILITSFIIALSGALMPGPFLTATISESARKGFSAGPLMIIGHGILELLLVVALMLGLAPFLKNDTVFGAIAVSGAFILLWMAFGMFRSLPTLQMVTKTEDARRGGLIMTGILMSVANPYWAIWWATIGLGYIVHSQGFGFIGVLLFFVGHILADLVWYSAVSFSISRGKSFLSIPLYRSVIGVCACFLVVMAVYFGYSGFEKFAVIN